MNENRLPRRKVLQWFAAAGALEVVGLPAFTQEAQSPATKGYGTDPKLVSAYNPGDFWPLTMTDAQKKATNALADVILPADDFGPAASAVRVGDFIDEWISAPYPKQQSDREIVLPGLEWVDLESKARFGMAFADLSDPKQKIEICDDLCAADPKSAELKKAANFFHRFSTLCTGAYYSTAEGWKAIGYVGNMPSGIFAGPPQEVLDQLGLEQTVAD